jgi:hypothetical protein
VPAGGSSSEPTTAPSTTGGRSSRGSRRRLRYTWHIATDPANATEVEIAFAADGDRTKVHVVHRGFDRLGEFGEQWRRTNRLGWAGVLPDYRRACAAAS